MMEEIKQVRPLVTFALFAYNQERYIREAIKGAFSQNYERLEIILSDDCSEDRTFEIMQEMAEQYDGVHRVVVRQNKKNLGLAFHINEIVKAASGEIITWAAGDDVSLAHRTKRLVSPMINNSNVVGVHSTVFEIDVDGNHVGIRAQHKDTCMLSLSEVCIKGTSVVSQSHAFRSFVFKEFGLFREDLTNEGPVMAFRELLLGEVVYIDEPLTLYRLGSGVSTYNGVDIYETKTIEPIKISNWRRTSFLQMLDDARKMSDKISKEQRLNIEKNVRRYTNIWNINRSYRPFKSTIDNFILNPRDLYTARALVRVLLPKKLYRFFLRRTLL